MADELTTNFRLKLIQAAGTKHLPAKDANCEKTFDVTGDLRIDNVQTVGFGGPEAVLAGDVPIGNYIYLENIDDTNYVELLDVEANAVLQLLPGDFAFFRTGADFLTGYWLLADTADVEVRVLMIGEVIPA